MILLARKIASRRIILGRARPVSLSRPPAIRGRTPRDQVHDGLDGDAAGDLAGVVTTHAVGQHEQSDVWIEGDGVFVVLPHLARSVARRRGVCYAGYS